MTWPPTASSGGRTSRMRKIAVVTGTRAEYGLLYWLIRGIHEDAGLELQLIVTGMHLAPQFGLTVTEIEKDGFPIAERVPMPLSSDTPQSVSAAMGIGMAGFAKAYDRLRPDILVVLGDRFETFAAAASAVPFRIPIAHIHGGEITEGAMDEMFRHAITKLSTYHFASTKEHAKRIIQMGERPGRVFNVGAMGLDNIKKLKLLKRDELAGALGIPQSGKWGIMTYHPVTLEDESNAGKETNSLLDAALGAKDVFWVITKPNADTGNRAITAAVEKFASKYPKRAAVFDSLGSLKYLSLLNHASVMLGNSSSGILEAPSFKLPVVNVGPRQKGRLRAGNVIDVEAPKKVKIADALRRALSSGFNRSLKGLKNPYGHGGASDRIIKMLGRLGLEQGTRKRFYDIIY